MRLAFVDGDNAFVDEEGGGGEVNVRNAAPRLRKFFDVVYVPSVRRIAALRSREDAENLAEIWKISPSHLDLRRHMKLFVLSATSCRV